MQFHPENCTVIMIKPNRRRIIDSSYQTHGHTLEVVDSSKYLGVTISEDLTLKKHIDDTINTGNKTLGFVRRNLRDSSASVKTVPKLPYVVRPRLKFSSTVWDPTTPKISTGWNKSDSGERQALPTVTTRNVHQDV